MNRSTQMKVLAPVMTRDVVLPNSSKKVQMVMVPVPDTSTMMAFPWSTITQLKQQPQQQGQQILMMDNENQINSDELEARELLNWSDGVGTLDGCDLKFKINQFGCLELLDSDDECLEPFRPQQEQQQQQQQHQKYLPKQQQQRQLQLQLQMQQQKLRKQAAKTKQISSGVSLLRDGPLDPRRPKPPVIRTKAPTTKPEKSELILKKLIPKDKLDDIKVNVNDWTVNDVKSFIDSIPGCSGLGNLFESHEICGQSLMYLDQKDLLEIIDVKLGPAVKIHNAISLLKS